MYQEDSFFTLGMGGRAGLLALTLCFSLFMLWLATRLRVRIRHWWVRGAVALVLFWAFVWLSPQIYYAYYLLIFDGLPVQIVVKSPPGPGFIVQMLGFQGQASLSAHGQALLGWMIIIALLRPVRI